MIKLKDILTEDLSATEVNKLEKMSTPKMMEIDFLGMKIATDGTGKESKGKRQKRKYKVVKDTRSHTGRYRFFQLKDLKPEPKVFNNYELVIDERKLKAELRAVMGYATNRIAKKIFKVKVR
tara:strand:- start:97 stop:462 length:366 start_codon:yes stop_codon:yes gene_type:complete